MRREEGKKVGKERKGGKEVNGQGGTVGSGRNRETGKVLKGKEQGDRK